MAWIDKNLDEFVKNAFQDRKEYVYTHCEYRTRGTSRFLQVPTILVDDKDIHYEYIKENVELHLEGKYQSNDYKSFVKELKFRTARNSNLRWFGYICRLIDAKTKEYDDLVEAFQKIMEILDPIIEYVEKKEKMQIWELNHIKGIPFFQKKV